MADNTYRKKNYAKFLPKAGGAAAAALIMTVALSTQAHAAEVEETIYQPVENPPVDGAVANAPMTAAMELPGVNEAVAQDNGQTIAENTEIAEENQQVVQENNASAESNEAGSGGILTDPGLVLPDAPEVPVTDGLQSLI